MESNLFIETMVHLSRCFIIIKNPGFELLWCVRESVCLFVHIQRCAFRNLQYYTGISFCPKFYSVFLVLNLHVKGKETCKEKFAVCYDYCLDPNL